MNLKQHLIILKDVHDLFKTPPVYSYENVSYCNWWKTDAASEWFTRYLEYWFPDDIKKTKVRFYSVFGKRRAIEEKFDGIKIFYTGENVEPRIRHLSLTEREEKAAGWDVRMRAYQDYGMSCTDLSIGFGYHDENNYFRLPFWILRYIEPESNLSDVKLRLEELEVKRRNAIINSPHRYGAAVIASHDFFGTRACISDAVKQAFSDDFITYGGKWRNNSNLLWTECHNDKEKFLSNFLFNICPENMDAPGYVTEKIFDALTAGTVPVYGGALSDPEPGILNRNSFILWNYDKSNRDALDQMQMAMSNCNYYNALTKEPFFVPQAADFLYDNYLSPLYERFSLLFRSFL